jgi:acyl-CoA oxidase
MEQTILASFMAGIAGCDDPEARDVLERLCSLYALESIHSDRAWYLEHHRVSAARSKAIGDQIDALCRELRPHGLPLVEGMGIPAPWLSAAVVEAAVVDSAVVDSAVVDS